jgi:hypothetical protein
MAFDKTEYRKNREQGLRGQGEAHKESVTTLNRHRPINRASDRRKIRDFRTTTKTTLGQRKTDAERLAIHHRVKRTEAGEQERTGELAAARG